MPNILSKDVELPEQVVSFGAINDFIGELTLSRFLKLFGGICVGATLLYCGYSHLNKIYP